MALATVTQYLPTLLFAQFLMTENPPTEHTLPTTIPQNAGPTSTNSGGNRRSSNRPSTSRGTSNQFATPSSSSRRVTQRPITRSTTRVGSAIRGLASSQRVRSGPAVLIEIGTDSNED